MELLDSGLSRAGLFGAGTSGAGPFSAGPSDLAIREVLRILLEDQVHRLAALRADAGVVLERSRHTIDESQWAGPAYEAYSLLAQKLRVEVANAAASLDEAAMASSRALATLSERP